ncbi:gliding motility-associated ABC transporter permease subunit GldF [Gangjinia marincola]|uniref:Gliding motility-associated ABC transporter permease subunit GldF n=1 Tax=Gangjinia marincola TaxID=578463 RepID=A0ABN1MG52_9FLAO
MTAIIIKEIQSFFSSAIGYLVIGLFLIINGLFLWVFPGEFNVFDYGFAELTSFFRLAPWVFIFLIPAVTMRSFAEEKRQGTLELLLTKPISKKKLVLAKYLGNVLIVILALIPTLLYLITISQLGNPAGNFDVGATVGSYLGLFFLGAVFTAVGVFASTLSQHQIVAFILAVFLAFTLYYAFDPLVDIEIFNSGYDLSYLGMNAHYKSISRGVLDTRDLIYFLSLIILFLGFTYINLHHDE